MSPIEDRLRDAYQAKAAQLTEQRLDQFAAAREHGLDDLLGTEHTAELPVVDFEAGRAAKRHHRWIAPLLAAAAVAAVAIGVTAVTGVAHDSKPKPNPPASRGSTPPPSSSAPAPSPSSSSQTAVAPPYLPAGQTGSRDQVPWSAVGSGWRLLQPAGAEKPSSKLYLYDPDDGRYLITDALPSGASVVAWSPDGRRAMLRREYTYQQLDLRSATIISRAELPGDGFVTYTKPRGTAMILYSINDSGVRLLQRYSTDGRLEQTYSAGSAKLNAGAVLYTPDGRQLVAGTDTTPVVFSNDGRMLRQFPAPAGFPRCFPEKWWTPSAVLEQCVFPGKYLSMFVQPFDGGPPTELVDWRRSGGVGYSDAWKLGNGDVLLHTTPNCGAYQILHAGSGALTPLRGPSLAPSPQFISHVDNDVATFVVNGPGCVNDHPGAHTLIDYNMMTGQTTTLLAGDAQLLNWPGDRG